MTSLDDFGNAILLDDKLPPHESRRTPELVQREASALTPSAAKGILT